MFGIDEITRLPIEGHSCIIGYKNDQFVIGIVSGNNFPQIKIQGYLFSVIPEFYEAHKLYSNLEGEYILDCGLSKQDVLDHKYRKGIGYPYTFPKKYEAVESFKLFNSRQELVNPEVELPLSGFLKYTFGLEFETSCGIIPEDVCFRDGLIPLRDGSISGNEYSTVVLKGNKGLNLLKQQLDTLKKYTNFDKECSLHIHMGNFPLEPERIYSLYSICFLLQKEFSEICPKFTFCTSRYKTSGKDYCKPLKKFNSFESLYQFLSNGRSYLGSMYMPHPNDIQRCQKWHIPQRYYWANFINLCFYDVNKTMEFRLLRPTYNFHKILVWLYIFNAILSYAETNNVSVNQTLSLRDIIKTIYPQQIFEVLDMEIEKLKWVVNTQSACGDYIGNRVDVEDMVFEPNEII